MTKEERIEKLEDLVKLLSEVYYMQDAIAIERLMNEIWTDGMPEWA